MTICDASFVGRLGSAELLTEVRSRYPEHEVYFVGPDSLITADFRTDRIRVYLDADGLVCEPLSEG